MHSYGVYLSVQKFYLFNPPLPSYWLYLGHQCSWTLTQANSMQVTNIQSLTATRSNQAKGKV